MKEYVERRGEGYYVAGSRVSLDSIVMAYWRGQAPESILREPAEREACESNS